MRLPLFELRVGDRDLASDEMEIEVIFTQPEMLAAARQDGGRAQVQVWFPAEGGPLRFGSGPWLARDDGASAVVDLAPTAPSGVVRPSVAGAAKLVVVLELLPDDPSLIPEWRQDQVHCFVRRRATA